MTARSPGAGRPVSSGEVTSPIALIDVAATVPRAEVRGNASIRGVSYRSRDVRVGDLFFCVPGSRADGHAFAIEAASSGASALAVERWVDVDLPQVRVPSVRESMGPMSASVFGRPSEGLLMIGVTGTHGKTSA